MYEKWVCIKNFNHEYFELGKIYEFLLEKEFKYLPIYNYKNKYYFACYELEDFFIPLEEWRENQIDKILNN